MTLIFRIRCPRHASTPAFGCKTCRTAADVEDAAAAHRRALEPDDEGRHPREDDPPVKVAWEALVAARARHEAAAYGDPPAPPPEGGLFGARR